MALRELLGGLRAGAGARSGQSGGRYSVLSNVGLLPAAVLRARYRGDPPGAPAAGAGAGAGIKAQRPKLPSALGRRAEMSRSARKAKTISVLVAYADRPRAFSGRWYVQLWAESLGKARQGARRPLGRARPGRPAIRSFSFSSQAPPRQAVHP